MLLSDGTDVPLIHAQYFDFPNLSYPTEALRLLSLIHFFRSLFLTSYAGDRQRPVFHIQLYYVPFFYQRNRAAGCRFLAMDDGTAGEQGNG